MRAKKIILRSFLGFLILIFIILLFLPLISKKIIISNSKEWIGRSISLEKLKVNYFTGTVKLVDLKLFESDDITVFVGFDTLIIDTEPYRFISDEIIIEQLYLKGLKTNVVMYDSGFNFDDLIAFHKSEESHSEEDTTSTSSLKFELSDFELNDAVFTLDDASIGKQMELSNLNFFVPYLSWDQEHSSEAGLKFNFKNGGYFQSSIDLNPKGGDFIADIILQDLDITGYSDFVKKYIDIGKFTGQTDLEVNLKGNIQEPENTIASGTLALKKFLLSDHGYKKLFGVDQLKVKLKEANPAKNRFVIDSIRLLRPSGYFEMLDSTNNITDYVDRVLASIPTSSDSSAVAATPDDSDTTELYYALNSLLIEEGVVDIMDKRTGEPFKYHLSEIEMSTDSIFSNSVWIESQSTMLLNNRGNLVAQVGLNPNDPMDRLRVDYTITDFMLSDLNIYSNHYMGFPILYGDMYYKAHTEINGGQIASENKLIIHNVELGEKRGGLYDLPLKFALFLLKDKDGVINLDVPVSGDLKDPEVSVGKIVWNTFKNLIVKTAAAPVKLLSGLIGADPGDIEAIEYDYLDTTFTEKRQHQLDLLLQLEQEKPDLEIELIYLNDPRLEKQQIAMTEVGKMFESKNRNKSYQADATEFESFVREKINGDSISLVDACLQLADPVVVDSAYFSFERKRITDVKDYLFQQNDSTEILIVPYSEGAPKNLGSKPRLEVKFGMKEEQFQ